ncbi:MAG TPA: hemerythrin domain-containing protein [Acidimicrobiia bacterium]|nr:hemerythrin domain-containing protein [Acidimicrobiia bacterium]
MSPSAATAPARTEQMAVTHRIYRRGFSLVADLVRRTPAGDPARSESIAAHLDFLLNSLHHHHSGEDENIWPRLLERAAPQAELIERMETNTKWSTSGRNRCAPCWRAGDTPR